MILKFHSWPCIQRKTWSERIHAPQCSLPHCLPRQESTLNIQRQRNGQRHSTDIQCILLNNKIMPFAAVWVDLEIIILSEVRQRKRNILWAESGKKWYKQSYLQNRNRLIDLKKEFMVTRGEGVVRELGADMYTLQYLKWITNKNLLYNTRNSAQYYVTTKMGKEFEKE